MADNEEQIFDAITQFSQIGADDVVSAAGEIQSAMDEVSGGVDVEFSVTVDDSDISSLTELEDAQFDVTLVAELEDDSDLTALEDLDGAMFTPGIDPALDEQPITDVTDLDSLTVSPDIEAKETDEGKEVVDRLNALIALEAVEIIMNVGGTILDVLGKIDDFTTAPILASQEATAQFAARTGQAIEDTSLIFGIFKDDLGQSKEEIAAVATEAAQLNLPIEEATRAALTFTHTFTEQNPVEVLRTLDQLMKSGAIQSYAEGADLLVGSFQQGNNRGGDLLATIQNNAVAMKDLGVTGTEWMALINSGLDAGFNSASDVTRAVTDLEKRLSGAAGNAEAEPNLALKQLGLENPKETGEAVGVDFIEAVAAGIASNPEGQFTQDQLAEVLFGRQGIKSTSAIFGLSAAGAETGPFADLVGQAEEAATIIDDTLSGAIDDFLLVAQAAAEEFLSSDQIGLDDKINAIKEGLQDAVEILSEGGTLGEALEQGLKIQGAEDFITNLERVFGNIGIILLQAVAAVQSLQGLDNTATLAEIARLGEQQLAFDLKVANPDEVAEIFAQAASRGVSTANMDEAMTTALNEMFANADFSGMVDLLQGFEDEALAKGASPEAARAYSDQFVGQLDTAFVQSFASGDFDIAKKIGDAQDPDKFQEAINKQFAFDPAALDASVAAFTEAIPDTTHFWDPLKPPETLASDTQAAVQEVQTAADETAAAVEEAAQSVETNAEAMALAAQLADTDIAAAMSGNSVTASFDAVAASAEENFPAAIVFVEELSASIDELDAQASVNIAHLAGELNALAQLASSVFAAVETAKLAGSGLPPSGGNTTNVTVNQTNNNASGAENAAASERLLTDVRGFGI